MAERIFPLREAAKVQGRISDQCSVAETDGDDAARW